MKNRFYKRMNTSLCLLALLLLSPTLAIAGEIHDSVLNGDIGKVKRILRKSPSLINSRDECGWTPLSLAAMTGSEDMIKLLLARGANVKDENELGWTPLHMAGSIEAAVLLVKAGADVNASDWHYCIPYNYAPTGEIAKFYISRGAKPSRRGYGYTHIGSAAQYGDIKTVGFFLSRGSGINIKDRKGTTLLASAVWATGSEETKLDVVKFLISKGAEVNTGNGWTILQAAAYDSSSEVVKCLVLNGAKINVISKNGDTPLGLASRSRLFAGHHVPNSSCYQDISDKKRIIDLLIDHGAEIHTITEAISAGDVEKVNSFLIEDPSLMTHLDYFNTALHCAAFWGRTEVVEYLLQKGAPLEIDSEHGTPLNVAAMMGNCEIVKLLIAHGAKVNSVNRLKDTPLCTAVSYGTFNLITWYDDPHQCHTNSPSTAKRFKKDDFLDTVKLLIEAGAEVNFHREFYCPPTKSYIRIESPLQTAIKHDWKEMTELLRKHGAKE